MVRAEFYHDPNAPSATKVQPAASAFVQNEAGAVLMIQRTDNGLWSIPGGAMELGESLPSTAIRETREETGIDIAVTGVIGIYSDPERKVAYSDGEIYQEFSVCFRGEPLGGTPTINSEAREVRWTEPAELAKLDIHPAIQLRITHGLQGNTLPYIG